MLNRRPRTFALVYFLLMVGFAGVYALFPPTAFYHSTARYERFADEADVANKVGSVLIERFKKQHPKGIDLGQWRISDHPFVFVWLSHETDPPGLAIRVFLETTLEGAPEKSGSIATVLVDLRHDPLVLMSNGPDQPPTYYFKDFPAVVTGGPQFDATQLFPPCVWEGTHRGPCIVVPSDVGQKLTAFGQASQGFPAARGRSFLRMLYFSAVTISTLGYGDIVPLTDWARVIVTLEIILGPVLLGMFITAVMNRTRPAPV